MKRKNILIYAIIIILIAVTWLIYFLANSGDDGAEVISSKENAEEYIIDKYKDGFLTYNGVELISYDTKMEQKWVLAIDEKDASVNVCEKYILLYADDTDRIYVIKDGKLSAEFKTEKDLRSATINENGYVTALTSDKGYKGQCHIYDETGDSLGEYSFGEKYILSGYLASDNKNLVLNVMEDNDENYINKVLFMDLKKGELKKEYENTSIAPYMMMHNDKILLGTDNALLCFDKNGKEKWSYDYDKGDCLFIGLSPKNITLVLKSDDNFGGNEVVTLNLSGRVKGKYVSGSQVKSFDTSEGYSAVYVNDEIVLLNKRGHIVSTIDAENNIKDIVLFKNDNRVMTISNTAIIRKFGR